MHFEILRKRPLVFHEQNGFKFFEPFSAVDKKKKPVKVYWRNKDDTSIAAASTYNDDISLFNLSLNKKDKFINGDTIVANPERKGLGEILNLAALITMKENAYSKMKVFSLNDSIQFFAKYGFNIVSSNISEILHNLKFLSKVKDEQYLDKKLAAQFFRKQIKHGRAKENKSLLELSNNLISDYIRELARKGQKISKYDLYNHTDMEFNSLDMIRNRDYLNELLDKHEISYTI